MSGQSFTRIKITANQVSQLCKLNSDNDELITTMRAYGLAPEDYVHCDICGANEDVYEWVTLAGDAVEGQERECANCITKAANTAVFTTYFLQIN
jgi:hypothetical protein